MVLPQDIIIALDDGHGMCTTGKRTPIFPIGHPYEGTFMPENEFNQEVVKLLGQHLQQQGFNILFTAPGDCDTPLKTRVDLANNKTRNIYNRPATIFVSVHANAFTGKWGHANGIETFIYARGGMTEQLGQAIHDRLIQGTPLRNRGLKTSSFYVLRETTMPAVLVECGFMDHLHEAKLLKSKSYREECALEIARGIFDFYRLPIKDN